MNRAKASDIDCMQLMRIIEHPIKINDDLIVVDELETGSLKLYECAGGPLDIHHLFTDIDAWKNAALVAKITIDQLDRDSHLSIRNIFCERGYEHLAAPLIYHVISFGKFYDSFQSVRIAEDKREQWFLHAGGVLQDFHRKDDGYYEYHIR